MFRLFAGVVCTRCVKLRCASGHFRKRPQGTADEYMHSCHVHEVPSIQMYLHASHSSTVGVTSYLLTSEYVIARRQLIPRASLLNLILSSSVAYATSASSL